MAFGTPSRLGEINDLAARIKIARAKLSAETNEGQRYELSVSLADMIERFNELWGAMILGARGELLGKRD